MNINKLGYNFFSHENTEVKKNENPLIESLENLSKKRSEKPEKTIVGTANLQEGMFKLSPLERYKYMAKQATLSSNSSIKLQAVLGDPEMTISKANKVINDAVMPPLLSNPNRKRISEAMQLKRSAESILDKAA
ncbi:MAG: hypothetical protein Kow0029_30250 [Candidatus Rifleibacteriota bacterium]